MRTKHYLDSIHQHWNKSKALNYALKKTISIFALYPNINMIFHSKFIKLLILKINK
jgi:hypothetical protein